MADADDLRQVKDSLNALKAEVESLRGEIAALKASGRPSSGPPSRRIWEAAPARSAPAAAKKPVDKPWEPPPALSASAAAAAPAASAPWSLERFIGEQLLHYVGMGLLALGIVFFLIWRAAHTGPGERAFMAASAGAALVALGQWTRKRPPYDRLSHTLIGGGWTVLYLTAYAAYHFPATKILDTPLVEVSLLGAAAVGMIAHGLSLPSRAFRLYGFGLTYAVFFLARQELPSFEMFLVLLIASVLVSVETGEADILLVTVPGYYLNYLPVYWSVVLTQAPQRDLAHFLRPFGWLAGAYTLIAALPLLRRPRRRLFEGAQLKLADAALCLNALLFAGLGASMGHEYFGHAHLARALLLSLTFVVPALLYLRALPSSASISSVLPVLGLCLIAAGVLDLPDPTWKLLAWTLVAGVWVWTGLFVDHAAWRVSGLTMAGLTFFFYLRLASDGERSRQAAAEAMLAFSAMSYLFSRFYRTWLQGRIQDWEKPAMEYWLYLGTAGLLLGLWGLLRPAPFAVALIFCGLAGELAAARFGRVHLWAQACAVELAAAVYAGCVDHGANLALAGPLTPRLLTSGCVAAGLACLVFADPTPRSLTKSWPRWSHEGQRRLLSWALLGTAALAVYQEFDPRLRLPVWAVGAPLLYYLGRRRANAALRTQGMLLAALAVWDGAFGYLFGPSALMARATPGASVAYMASALVLLGGLFVARDASFDSRTATDFEAGWLFSLACLTMLAVFAAKELESYQVTLAWTGEGIAFLAAGLALGLRELRIPSLGLLCVCVGKALLVDLSGLALPYRVASFVALGVVLLLASTLYVRTGKDVR